MEKNSRWSKYQNFKGRILFFLPQTPVWFGTAMCEHVCVLGWEEEGKKTTTNKIWHTGKGPASILQSQHHGAPCLLIYPNPFLLFPCLSCFSKWCNHVTGAQPENGELSFLFSSLSSQFTASASQAFPPVQFTHFLQGVLINTKVIILMAYSSEKPICPRPRLCPHPLLLPD